MYKTLVKLSYHLPRAWYSGAGFLLIAWLGLIANWLYSSNNIGILLTGIVSLILTIIATLFVIKALLNGIQRLLKYNLILHDLTIEQMLTHDCEGVRDYGHHLLSNKIRPPHNFQFSAHVFEEYSKLEFANIVNHVLANEQEK